MKWKRVSGGKRGSFHWSSLIRSMFRYSLLSQHLQFSFHISVLKLRVVITADVGGVGVAANRGGVSVHQRTKGRVRALDAAAVTWAPEERHGPLHEVPAAWLWRVRSQRRGLNDLIFLSGVWRQALRRPVCWQRALSARHCGPGLWKWSSCVLKKTNVNDNVRQKNEMYANTSK